MIKNKIPFDVKYKSDIESGKYKVYTSHGEPAEIVKWNCRGLYPLLVVMFDGYTDDCAFFNINGKGMTHPDINYIFLSEE